ncbi:hypothetical protein I552_4267 [Mycobacterium xenopi 3993]|nr:hypothetical protein I552_4267 [Mycobacterium xenopi 3993]
MLLGMVAKSVDAPDAPRSSQPNIPVWGRPVAALSARQLREREARRDRLIRAIWVLRGLLREYGHRLVESGVLKTVDDVFYLLVDELDAVPADASELVARRRAEQRRLMKVVPPRCSAAAGSPVPRWRRFSRPGKACTASGCVADASAAAFASCDRRPSASCSPVRFSSPRSPTSATPPRSRMRPPW